jgi:cyclopropane-fatty-acyl-phospholipid synthase
MVEAVGERYWPVYFAKLRHLLADDGIAVLQAITIADERFAAYRRRPDFIQRYIFPGGMLPSVEIIRREAERAGLRTADCEAFGGSYARTLAEWRRRFLRAWPKIAALGFDARFQRMWDYYLAYCETGFRSGAINVHLLKLTPA